MERVRGEWIRSEDAHCVNIVIDMEQTFATLEQVRQTKMQIRVLKYPMIEYDLRVCEQLNLNIDRKGDDWREELQLLLPSNYVRQVGQLGPLDNDVDWVSKVLQLENTEKAPDRQRRNLNRGFPAVVPPDKQQEQQVGRFEKKGGDHYVKKESEQVSVDSSSAPPPPFKKFDSRLRWNRFSAGKAQNAFATSKSSSALPTSINSSSKTVP